MQRKLVCKDLLSTFYYNLPFMPITEYSTGYPDLRLALREAIFETDLIDFIKRT
jgi:hypothetical protein